MNALRLAAVSVSLGGACIVDRVSASVEHGEWVAVIGPNGAGKSTLLRAVTRLVAYDGVVEVLGDDAHRITRREHARRVAVVPQRPTLPPATSRIVCGTMIPTNPIRPLTATAAAVPIVAAATTSSRTRATRTPSAAASSSPTASTSSSRR